MLVITVAEIYDAAAEECSALLLLPSSSVHNLAPLPRSTRQPQYIILLHKAVYGYSTTINNNSSLILYFFHNIH